MWAQGPKRKPALHRRQSWFTAPTELLPSSQVRKRAVQALALTVPEWTALGESSDTQAETLEDCAERIASLLMVRIVAILASKPQQRGDENPEPTFPNLSTSAICQHTLIDKHDWWPSTLTSTVESQLLQLVTQLLQKYNARLPFHNYQHAYHVVLSANKLLDLLLALDSNNYMDDRPPPAFGLRHDPVALLALVFAALVHDVDHQGVSNRQLVQEGSTLALQYNDSSVNEQHSLRLSFELLLSAPYERLRKVLFAQDSDYRHFRATVVQMVLATDIASPERTQICKSKWKEGFSMDKEVVVEGGAVHTSPRRGSLVSDISMPRVRSGGGGRRGSVNSMVSELSMDSYSRMMKAKGKKVNMNGARSSSDDSILSSEDSEPTEPNSIQLKMQQQQQQRLRKGTRPPSYRRRNSTQSYNTTGSSFESIAQESVALAQKRRGAKPAKKEESNRKYVYGAVEDSSISLTPPSSDEEDDEEQAPVRGVTVSKSNEGAAPAAAAVVRKTSRRASTGNVPAFQPIHEHQVVQRFRRRGSVGADSVKSRGKRLGILRGMDFSGESIEVFSRGSIGGTSVTVEQQEHVYYDEPDELRASVVLELILRASDISHMLQSWKCMARWSSLLFEELTLANKANRGRDPAPGWFDNQAKAMENYALPLAGQLDETGIFGEFVGAIFAQRINANRDKWLVKGYELTSKLIKAIEGKEQD